MIRPKNGYCLDEQGNVAIIIHATLNPDDLEGFVECADVSMIELGKPPPKNEYIPFADFMALFTESEQAALVDSSDPKIKVFLLATSGAGEVRLANPRVEALLDDLIAAGALAAPRKTQILAGAAPA